MQVKLRGFRIELGEVEAAISDIEGIQLAVAMVLKDPAGSDRLAAYYTPGSVETSALVASLKKRLPAHFLPSLFVPLARMPLLPNEKVDRRALASRAEYQPDWAAAAEQDEYVAPRSELERAVQAVWQEVLGLEQVSVESDFFRIGGNSITANKVTSRLRAALDAQSLSGGALFKHPTIAALAELLQAAGAGQGAGAGRGQMVPVAGYDAAALAAGTPVSSQQEQLLRGELDPLMYIEEVAIERLVGDMDVDALIAAWEAMVMRHATLRTRFKDDGGRLLQVRAATILGMRSESRNRMFAV